jgi:hypothetical protein
MSKDPHTPAADAAARRLLRFVISLSLVISCLGLRAAQTPATLTLTIRADRPAQTIHGFGASGCWWAQEIGDWPAPERAALLRLLYDKNTGAALTIYRHNLGAGTAADDTMPMRIRRTESHLDPATGRYDWNRDAPARRILREALDAGAAEVILFANSAPVSMTKNGRGYGARDAAGKPASNLAPERHPDYARYLADITEHLLRVDRIPVTALSPVNEPEWDWSKPNQEGSHHTPAEAAAITRAVRAELARRALPVRVEAPEGGSWKTALPYFAALNISNGASNKVTDLTRPVGPDLVSGRELPVRPPTHARPDTRSGPTKSCRLRNISKVSNMARATTTATTTAATAAAGAPLATLATDTDAPLADFAIHSYWSDTAHKKKLRAWLDRHRPDARLHMTEWCDMKPGLAPGIDGALPLARTLIEDLTLGRVTTWSFWLAASPYDYRDALVHYDRKTRALAPTKRLWTLGQFSRYLVPRSIILPVQTSDKTTPALAARLPDGRLALVCANPAARPKTLSIKIAGAGKTTWRPVLRALTDATHDLAETPIPPGAAAGAGGGGGGAGGGAACVLPPQSILTVILAETPPAP